MITGAVNGPVKVGNLPGFREVCHVWNRVAAGARALKEKAERSGASPCEFDYQVGRRGCLLLAIGPVREAQNPAASSRVLRAPAVRSSTPYDLRFTRRWGIAC